MKLFPALLAICVIIGNAHNNLLMNSLTCMTTVTVTGVMRAMLLIPCKTQQANNVTMASKNCRSTGYKRHM